MKDVKTKERFIELRGQGLPLAKIAAEINVSKTTLINWERDFREEIDNLRAVELEALYDKYYLSVRKKVEFFGDVLNRIRGELETRDLSTISTDKLFAMMRTSITRRSAHCLKSSSKMRVRFRHRNQSGGHSLRYPRVASKFLDVEKVTKS